MTDNINAILEEGTLEEIKQLYKDADSNNERVAINEYLEKRFNFSYECTMSPECPCEDCQKWNVKMD